MGRGSLAHRALQEPLVTPLQIAVHRVNSQQAALSAAKVLLLIPRGRVSRNIIPGCRGKRLRSGEEPRISHIVSSASVVTDKAKALPRTQFPTAGLSAARRKQGFLCPRGGREDNR